MSDPPKKTDWTEVEGALQRVDPSTDKLPASPEMNAPADLQQHPIVEKFGGAKGVMMEFQAGRIRRGATISALKEWHSGQLEVAKIQIQEAVRVHTAQASVQAEKFLETLNQEYLAYLGELGLKNTAERQQMIIRLNDQTSKSLRQVMDADWPENMKATAIANITRMQETFADKLLQEVGSRSD